MPLIEDRSIDLILCDLPYGITANKWDSVISLEGMWDEYERMIKDKGIIVLTATMGFASELIRTAKVPFRYDLVWEKPTGTGFLNANKMPLRAHEHVLVFYKSLGTYHPQKVKGIPFKTRGKLAAASTSSYGYYKRSRTINNGEMYPRSVIKIKIKNSYREADHFHPTQKPVPLFEYLIKTYTNEGDLVLDNCAGSGTTGVACKNLNRRCILIEKEYEYAKKAVKRIGETHDKLFHI